MLLADAGGSAACLQCSRITVDEQLGEASKYRGGFRRHLNEGYESAGPGRHGDFMRVQLFFGREAVERLTHVQRADGNTFRHGVESSVRGIHDCNTASCWH